MKIRAIVKRRRRIRTGRGFSRGELRDVNLSVKEALRLGIPVDIRRSTRHGENIDILKSFLKGRLQAEEVSEHKEAISEIKVKKQIKSKVEAIQNLMQVPGIGEKRAHQLKDAGIDSIEKLVKADPKEISEKLRVTEKSASKWISNAEQILSQKELKKKN